MQRLFYIFLLLIGNHCFAKTNAITIKGTATNKDYKEPVQNALIILVLSSGDTLTQKTDHHGSYEFKFGITAPSACTITISITKDTKSASVRNGCFLNLKDIGMIAELQSDREYVKDFELVRALHCGEPHFSPLVFKTNSIVNCNDSLHQTDSLTYDDFETAINSLLTVLKENPTMIIELQGHASSIDRKPKKIALKRARSIKKVLVSKGIDKTRIQTKSWSNLKELVPDEVIENTPTKQEQMTLHLKNQRVIFRIISWDFVKKSEEEVPDMEGK